MPYDPKPTFDARYLYQGLSDGGVGLAEGIQRYHQNLQQMDSLNTAAQLIAQQHPDAVDPDMLDKFSKGSLGQRQALVGQMTAAVADKYKQQQMQIEQQNADTHRYGIDVKNQREIDQSNQQQQALNFNMQRYAGEYNSQPNTLTDATGNTYMWMPGSKQLPVQINRKSQLLPEPPAVDASGKPMRDANGGVVPAPWETHNGADGKPIMKTRWNPYTGKTEMINLREAAPNPMAALLSGGGTPAAPAPDPLSGSAGTGTAPAPGAAPTMTPAGTPGVTPSGSPPLPTSSPYKSPADVKAAMQANKLTRDQAAAILRNQFGYQ